MSNTIVVHKMTKMGRFCHKVRMAYWSIYRKIEINIFEPVWYRFFGHKFHVVKTKLTPAPWYDTDTRMLYAVMALVEWFVENDMRIVNREDFELECKRIKVEDGDNAEESLKVWTEQWEDSQKVIDIYKWWKSYDKRRNEIDESLHEWYKFVEKFEDKDDILAFLHATKKMNEEEKKEERRLSDYHEQLDEQLNKEEQEMLMMAVKYRKIMWS